MIDVDHFEKMMEFWDWIVKSKKLEVFDTEHKYRLQGGFHKCLRILPLTYMFYLVSYLCNFVNFGEAFNNLTFFLKNNSQYINVFSIGSLLTFTNFIYPKWHYLNGYMGTLVLLWLFYLFFAYEKVNNLKKALKVFCVVGSVEIIILEVVNIVKLANSSQLLVNYIEYNFRGLFAFTLEICIYYFVPYLKQLKVNQNIIMWVAVFICLILLYCFHNVYNFPWIITCFGIAGLICTQIVRTCKIFVNPLFAFIGKNSLGFYYCHVLIYYFFMTI